MELPSASPGFIGQQCITRSKTTCKREYAGQLNCWDVLLLHLLYCTSNSAMLHFNFNMDDKLAEQELSGGAWPSDPGDRGIQAIEVLRGLQRIGWRCALL